MKKQFIKIILAICVTLPSLGKALQKPSITFTENKGQVSDQNFKPRPDILFSGHVNGMNYHLRNNGISYQLNRIDSWKEETLLKHREKHKVADKQTLYRLDINWLNINQNFTIQTEKPVNGFDNYYLEVCPNGATNVKTYEGVFYNNIYNKINLHYYQKDGALKYDYIVKPGANFRQIQFQVKGADDIKIQKNGSVIFSTPLGKIEEGAPVVYQNGKQLKAKWILKNKILSFDIENYDPQTQMIIDPATRTWGTYYGDAGYEYGHRCKTDESGNVYQAGTTDSNTSLFIATTGAHQSVHGGYQDAYLVKFNTLGTRQWATYYGGSGVDYGVSCPIDTVGNAYLAGFTSSTVSIVIATPGSHKPNPNISGNFEGFLAKFDSLGIRQWGTYYGGENTDYINDATVDAFGNIYVSGDSKTTGTGIATAGSHQSINAGGSYDGFLVKFNSAGVRQWGTFYGGAGSDGSLGCATDVSGNVYMTGYAQMSTGTAIATAGSHQSSYGTGGYDIFLVKFDSIGVRQWGTYYGGTGSEESWSCATDMLGNVYLSGTTQSSTGLVIATAGAHQSAFGGGTSDGFLAKFNSSGIRQWGTYYGGSNSDDGMSCIVDGSGNVYLIGNTTSTNNVAIATTGAHQTLYAGGTYNDAYIVKFNPTGIRQWGSYYGDTGGEYAFCSTTDSYGNVYLSGYTTSNTSTMIATPGAHQPTFGGGTSDAFLVQFFDCTPLSQPSAINGSISLCTNATTTYSMPAVTGATSYTWSLPSGWAGSSNTNTISVTSNGNSGILSVYAESGCTSSLPQTLSITVNQSPTITVNSGAICIGDSFTITPVGASSYTFSGGNAIVSPTIINSYSVTGTDVIGCAASNTAISTITVNSLPTINVLSTASLICVGQTASLTANGALNYLWNTSNTNSTIAVSPAITSSYTVNGTDVNGCSNSSIITQSVSLCTDLIKNKTEAFLKVYPNPLTDIIIIELPSSTTIFLFDALGKLIYQQHLNEGKNTINLSEFNNGIYLMLIKNEELYKTLKLIKE